MTKQPSSRDLDLLSVYLDGQLSQTDRARLESRLQTDPELRSVYEGLRQTRALLRQLPARRAPRNFRLTPQMVGIKPSLPRSFPIFRFASVLASILLFIGYAINLSASAASMAAPTAMAYDTFQVPASAEMATGEPVPAEEATVTVQGFAPKLAPTPTVEVLPSQQNALNITVTPETMSMSAPSTETMPQDDMYSSSTGGAAGNTARSVPQPPALPIHPGWLFGLLGLAVVSGAGAFAVRAQKQKLTRSDILLLSFGLVVALLLAASIYWMSVR